MSERAWALTYSCTGSARASGVDILLFTPFFVPYNEQNMKLFEYRKQII
jgi:hypothetical protein